MKKIFINKNKQAVGFTIIETIIVFAIAGLIMVVVLVAVREIQSHARDHQRRLYAQSVLEAMNEFDKSNGKFPGCDNHTLPLTTCKQAIPLFLTHYMPDGSDPSAGTSYGSSSVVEGSATGGWDFHTTSGTTYFYWFPNSDHGLAPQPGQIFIETATACHVSSPASGDGPVVFDTPHYPYGDSGLFSIVIYQEHGGYYCLDNYTGG